MKNLAPADAAPSQRPVQKRAEKTRIQIITAVIACLDKQGYADTSFNAIQTSAGMSRGSMTYHFPTRQDMILAAAKHMLDNALAGVALYFSRLSQADQVTSEFEVIQRFWSHIVNTPEGRAFIELMVAARTDSELREILSQMVEEWEAQIEQIMQATYGDGAKHIGGIWDLSRTYLQGLLLQSQVAVDPQLVERKMTLFAKLLGEQALGKGRATIVENI